MKGPSLFSGPSVWAAVFHSNFHVDLNHRWPQTCVLLVKIQSVFTLVKSFQIHVTNVCPPAPQLQCMVSELKTGFTSALLELSQIQHGDTYLREELEENRRSCQKKALRLETLVESLRVRLKNRNSWKCLHLEKWRKTQRDERLFQHLTLRKEMIILLKRQACSGVDNKN